MDAEFLSWVVICLSGGIISFIAGKFYYKQEYAAAYNPQESEQSTILQEFTPSKQWEKQLELERQTLRRMEANFKLEVEELTNELNSIKQKTSDTAKEDNLLLEVNQELKSIQSNIHQEGFLELDELDELDQQIDNELNMDL